SLGDAEGVLGGLGERREALGVGHREVRQNLAIDRHAGLGEPRHESAVGQAVLPSRRIDADDPQTPELALAGPAVTVGVAQRLLDRFLGRAVQLALAGVVALRQLEHLLASVTSLGSSLD